jgi:plasmid stabilization system protein ParE
MIIRYSSRATRDLDSIYKYLADRSPRGTVNVMAAIYAAIEFIRRNPEATPAMAHIPGTRAIVVHRYQFKIFYRALSRDGVVEIVHVRHTARRPWTGEAD